MNFISSILPTIEHYQTLSYGLILLIALVESLPFVGLVIPGSIFVLLLGFLAGQNTLDAEPTFILFLIGTLLGDLLSFYIGRKGKKLVKPDNQYLLKGEGFLKQHGSKSVLLGRFIGPLRPMISMAAGALKMNFGNFILWDVIAALLWVAAYGTIGYFFGQAWQLIAVWSTRVSLVLLFVAIFILVIWIIKRWIIRFGTPLFKFIWSILGSVKQAIWSNHEVKKLVIKYPRFFAFLGRRADRSSFLGLPLTLLLLAFLYFLALFFGTIESVVTSEAIVGADLRIENLLFVFRTKLLVKVFMAVTLLGQSYLVAGAAVVLTLILWLLRKNRQMLGLWVAFSGAAFAAFASKILIHRTRPVGVAVYAEDSFSFPSGHSTMAAVFYGYIIYLYWLSNKSWKQKLNALFGGLTLIILIGFSRLYLGVHYLSDVLGGYLLGTLWLIIGITISEWLIHKNITLPIPAVPKFNKRWAIAALITLWFCAYVIDIYKFQPPQIAPVPPAQVQIISGTDILDLFPAYKLSQYTETLTGARQEPVSFIIAARSDEAFVKAMTGAGWQLADQITPLSIFNIVKKAALNEQYDQAPMTPSFWNAEVHDFGFEKPTDTKSVRQRHHARFWKTDLRTPDGEILYVGTASLDTGIKWFLAAHQIDPAIDVERDALFNSLQNNNSILNWRKEQFVPSSLGKNAAGDLFFSDGKVYIIELK